MKSLHRTLALAALLSGMPLAQAAIPYYSVTAIGPAGSAAYKLNNAGAVVGYAGSSAFLYANGSATYYNAPGASSTWFTDINDDGVIAGNASVAGVGTWGLVYDHGSLTTYQAPTGYRTASLSAISNTGSVAGTYSASSYRAFADSGSGVQLLAPGLSSSRALDINAAGAVVGEDWGGNGPTAYLLTTGGATQIGNYANGSSAYAISDTGYIGGYYRIDSYNAGAFIRDPLGAITEYAVPWRTMILQGLNNDGVGVARGWLPSSPDSHAYLLLGGEAIQLNERLVDSSGWNIIDANGINDGGQIVGTGCFAPTGVCQAVLLEVSPIPEPGTWGMLLAGLAVVGACIRRRN